MESNNEEERERSVLLRHITEKHSGEKVNFDMKVVKTFQHDPLGRQCAEAVWIRNVEIEKRINNKKEYHQPGDVEVLYEKTENENYKKKRKVSEERKVQDKTEKKIEKQIGGPKPIETNIADFIQRMRENSKKKDNKEKTVSEDELIISTQNMISDARARREQRKNTFQCDICDYNSASEILLSRHKRSTHPELQYMCDQCDYKDTKEDSLNDHKQTQHKSSNHQCNQCDYNATTRSSLDDHKKSIHEKQPEVIEVILDTRKEIKKQKYVSKRIHCDVCDKKFNKKETFETHTRKYHSEKNQPTNQPKENMKPLTKKLKNVNSK